MLKKKFKKYRYAEKNKKTPQNPQNTHCNLERDITHLHYSGVSKGIVMVWATRRHIFSYLLGRAVVVQFCSGAEKL